MNLFQASFDVRHLPTVSLKLLRSVPLDCRRMEVRIRKRGNCCDKIAWNNHDPRPFVLVARQESKITHPRPSVRLRQKKGFQLAEFARIISLPTQPTTLFRHY